jgi:transposase
VLGGKSFAKAKPISHRFYPSEHEELETRARKYTPPYRVVISAKIVLPAAQGVANDIIAARLDTPRQIVRKWRKRFVLARLPGLEEQPRGGRPALFSPQRRGASKSSRL